LKVITGVEKKYRNVRIQFQRQLCEQDVFSLKAAGEAYISAAGNLGGKRSPNVIQPASYPGCDFSNAH
jgi:hypothetical protein